MDNSRDNQSSTLTALDAHHNTSGAATSSASGSSDGNPAFAQLPGHDLDTLWRWNQTVPPVIPRCMHDIISQVAREQPDAVAVDSWDGSLTYNQVERLSSQLARHLRKNGVQTGARMPLCFEKSMWAVVALLGALKAGATVSLTDPSQPESRLRSIVEQTSADIVVTSAVQGDLGRRICPDGKVIAVSTSFFEDLPRDDTDDNEPLPAVPATTPMYIIFTSGSTGRPKGVVLSHENYTSGAIPRAEAVGYKSTSWVFDFPSYAFDVSLDCMLCTLATAGRICVPSEEARVNDLSGAIRRSKANMVHMTPSVARVLDADIIPSLDVLGLGGEAVSASDAAAWGKLTNLVIAYGPSECTVGCTINNTVAVSTGIGRGVGGTTWIVDPDDHNRLVPVGAVGELLIEGPVVGVGYLAEPEKTAEVFINDPSWLVFGHEPFCGRRGRLYKTGDLVRYDDNDSGSIEFVGRKDQQVKLRGQRVELAEVEHHLRNSLPAGLKIAAEVIKPPAGSPALVAFICELKEGGYMGTFDVDSILAEPSTELSDALSSVESVMSTRVPRYMIPAAFVALQRMPTLVSGKTDRKKIREIGSSLPREKLMLASAAGHGQAPETETEMKLQRAWLAVLDSDAKVYKESNFFVLGGDSLRAMRLVTAARAEGLALTVAYIFTSPRLDIMATKAVPSTAATEPENVPAFSLLNSNWDEVGVKKEAAALCNLSPDDIADIYPCTPLQEALMALSAKVKEAYVAQRVVELDDVSQGERLKSAFKTTEESCPILRTRVIQVPSKGLLQVVVKSHLTTWHTGSELEKYLQSDRDETMDLGTPLVRYALIRSNTTDKVSFVLSMHHALYDGWSMPLIVDRINKAYSNEENSPPVTGFKHFIKYLQNTDISTSEAYWCQQLQGASGPQFPSLPWLGYQTKADSLLEVYVPLKHAPASNTTIATVIRAAWAFVVSQYINSNDIVFGETLTGRNAPVIGAETIEGPMITTVPVRVQIDKSLSVTEYLHTIQEQVVEQMPHEHFGLQHIRKLSPDAFEACELRTGLVLHPKADINSPTLDQSLPANRLVPVGEAEAAQEALKFNTYALMLVCSVDADGFLVMASFDSKTVEEAILNRMLEQFKLAAQQLCEQTSDSLDSIECITKDDFSHLRQVSCAVATDTALKEYSGLQSAHIVDSQDFNRILPQGGVGELLLQSSAELPLTKAATPKWANQLLDTATNGNPQGSFYKTGKLASFNTNNTVKFFTTSTKLPSAAAPAPAKRVSATSQKQKNLRSLWGRVLGAEEQTIGLNDNFFLLGGDSIAAMKLVSESRAEGIKLSVMQIFQNKTLYEMASVMQQADGERLRLASTDNIDPFGLLDVASPSDFVDSIIRPQLADATWQVSGVYPARPLQRIAVDGSTQVPRFSMRYELILFDEAVDRPRLFRSCQELVRDNEILRTVFIEHNDQVYGTVLEGVEPEITELDVDTDVEEFAQQLSHLDIQTVMPLGSYFAKWFFIRGSTGHSCLVFRLSHAQYDEICLPILLRQLSNLYQGKPARKTVPFSSYVDHVVRHSIPNSLAYWRELLAGSSMTTLRPDIPVERRGHFAIQRSLDISSRAKDMTVATIPTAAWALCLSRLLNLRDVTFGEVVSGRNLDFPNAEVVTGPCWQYVPVRVRFDASWTVWDLLNYIQQQHVASSAHEGVGLSEIIAQCTDWPDPKPDWFDSVVHQDVAHEETLAFDAANGRLQTVYPHEEPLREWKAQAFIQGEELTLEIVTVESWGQYAEQLLDRLVDAARFVVSEPVAPLFHDTSAA